MSGAELTIEQLAAATGLTVRNIRAHVTRGLLPPPSLRGRTGYYGDEHVNRLRLITQLQAQGFNLTAIQKLIEGHPDADSTVELYQRAVGWLPELPVEMTVDELAEMFGVAPDQTRLARLRRAGVVEPLEGDRVRVLNPVLMRVGARGTELGFDIESLLDVLDTLVAHTRGISEHLVRWFLTAHWAPYVAAGRPADRLPELEQVITDLQPMAAEGVLAAFQQAMSEAVDAAFKRITAEEIAAAQAAVPDPAPASG
jgi:hypothetical protein